MFLHAARCYIIFGLNYFVKNNFLLEVVPSVKVDFSITNPFELAETFLPSKL